MSYSGTATINFIIERYLDVNGTYVTSSDDENAEPIELELEISGSSYYVPAVTNRLPEDCYPAEGESEITAIYLNGKPFLSGLTEDEERAVIEQIQEAVAENDYCDL